MLFELMCHREDAQKYRYYTTTIHQFSLDLLFVALPNGDVEVLMMGDTEADHYQGYGEEAVFEPGGNSIRMVGWPRIMGMGREHRAASAGTVMTLFTKPARLQTQGRAQTRILQD